MPPREAISSERYDFSIRRSDIAGPMPRAHRHQEVEINYLEAGAVTYLIGGRLTRVAAGQFCFYWAAVPHRMLAGSSATGFWYVTVPLSWVLSWELPPHMIERLLDGRMLCDSAPRPGDPGRFAEWLGAIHTPDRRAEKPAMLEMEARFRRFALDNPRPSQRGAPASGSAAPAKIERLARFIVEHYAEPLTLAQIAAAAGLHPNYAANLFKKHCGQTLLQCVTQHRLAHAQRLLATTVSKVIDIAYESGFGSLSRFHEAFVAACGVAPAAYRRRFATPPGRRRS